MEGFEVQNVGSLVDALTAQGGYATRTKARKAIKNGAVKVDGNVVKIPSTPVEPGMEVKHDRGRKTVKKAPKNYHNKASFKHSEKSPFEIVFEDDNFLAYVKPAGWVTASPKPQMSTTYSRMKVWLEAQSARNRDLHFINKIEKDVSGICLIAKNRSGENTCKKSGLTLDKGYIFLLKAICLLMICCSVGKKMEKRLT